MVHEDRSVASLISSVADSLADQAKLYIEMKQTEATRDAKVIGRDMVLVGLALPPLGIGYVFCCVAIAHVLAFFLGPAAGIGIVGALNLMGGLVLLKTVQKRMRLRSDSYALTSGKAVPGEPGPSAAQPPQSLPRSAALVEVSHGG